MAKIFVSHSSADHYFVSLLLRLLEFHYLDAWCSLSDIQPGRQFPTEIDQGIRNSNILLVVSSENTAQSKWVTKEVAVFQGQNSQGLVVPLVLSRIDLDAVVPGLNQYQAIDFSRSMLEGFEKLFQLLGRDFLVFENRRNSGSRRGDGDRRSRDRRKADLLQRMRRGFLKAYYQSTQKDEFDEIKDTIREKIAMIEALQPETAKYKYFDDTDQECNPDLLLDRSTHKVWNLLKNKRTFKPVYLVEGIAEDLYEHYRVQVDSERRKSTRRSTDNRRK